MSEIKNQDCPFCSEKQATLREEEVDIPYFGRVFVLGLECSACGARKSEVEPAEPKEPCRYTLEIESENDLNIKVVKSAEATVKIPRIITVESGPASDGYVTNVEGIIERVKKAIQSSADAEDDDPAAKNKAKALIKKLNKVLVGRESLKLIIEDPSGHSAIISEKAQKSKL